MSGTLFGIYQSKVFILAKTIVFKHVMTAELINRELKTRGYEVNEFRPDTWKYYMNIAGEYHQSDIDLLKEKYNTPYMTIKVAGDYAPVDAVFNKDLISGPNADLATANEYRYGSQLYKNLLERYPEMESLILGILNPIEKQIAIDSSDGEILFCGGYKKQVNPYDTSKYYYATNEETVFVSANLVEANETNLIPELQKWLSATLERWNINDYQMVDDLYLASLMGLIGVFLPKIVMNIRLANCRTNQAHTYHIKQYLDSNGGLGQLVDVLAPKEYLWVYRNYRWLEANLGKQMTFDAIIDHIFTPTNLPVNSYVLRHNTLDIEDNISPRSEMIRVPVNFAQVGGGSSRRAIREILNKEIPIGRSNQYDLDAVEAKMQERVDCAGTSEYVTKVLESSVIDYSSRSPFPLAEVLLNTWLYTASHGFYKGTVYIDHPTQNERLQLTPLNAFILMLYCYNYGYTGVELADIPNMNATWIPRAVNFTPPKVKDQPYYTVDELYKSVEAHEVTREQMTSIHVGRFVQPSFSSTSNFYTGGLAAHAELMRRYFVYVDTESIMGRGYLENAASLMYWLDVPCTLSDGKRSYASWLNSHGIDFTGLSRNGFITFADKLVAAATGIESSRLVTMEDRQNAAVKLLKHFGSYNLQILSENTKGEVTLLEGKNIRYGNIRTIKRTQGYVPSPVIKVNQRKKITARVNIDMFKMHEGRFSSVYTAKIPLEVDAMKVSMTQGRRHTLVPMQGLSIVGVNTLGLGYKFEYYISSPLIPSYEDTATAITDNFNFNVVFPTKSVNLDRILVGGELPVVNQYRKTPVPVLTEALHLQTDATLNTYRAMHTPVVDDTLAVTANINVDVYRPSYNPVVTEALYVKGAVSLNTYRQPNDLDTVESATVNSTIELVSYRTPASPNTDDNIIIQSDISINNYLTSANVISIDQLSLTATVTVNDYPTLEPLPTEPVTSVASLSGFKITINPDDN